MLQKHTDQQKMVFPTSAVAQCLLQWSDGDSSGENTSNIFHAALTHE